MSSAKVESDQDPASGVASKIDVTSNAHGILGEVEVAGEIYRLHEAGPKAREVVRCRDGRSVGRLRGSPSSMWLLEPTEIDEDLLRAIVESAIEEGVLLDLASD